MLTIRAYESQLAAVGLNTLEGIRRFEGIVVDLHRGKSDTSRFTIQIEDGGTRTLFLKRNWKTRRRNAIYSFLRHGRVWSSAREEWENMLRLQQAGIATAALIAYAEDCGTFSENFSCIITESAGELSLERFIAECRDGARRKQVFAELAHTIRKMHQAGFASPDLFARHLFLATDAGAPGFALIDMARLDQRRTLTVGLRARDLSSLNASIPLRLATAKERLRFLKEYCGEVDRRLIKRIGRRMNRLLKREKFSQFGALDNARSD